MTDVRIVDVLLYFFLLTPPKQMEQTECSEKSAYKIHTPGNHPKEIMQLSENCDKFGVKKKHVITFLNGC